MGVANIAARAAASKPLRPTPAIPASPPHFVSMLSSLWGVETRVADGKCGAGADNGKGILDGRGTVAVLRGGRATGSGRGDTGLELGCGWLVEGRGASTEGRGTLVGC